MYNETPNHKILSEFKLIVFGITIDSICHTHGGSQKIFIKDSSNELAVIPWDLAAHI